jgi:hypothetical protein
LDKIIKKMESGEKPIRPFKIQKSPKGDEKQKLYRLKITHL